MRIIVMYDLPVADMQDRHEYSRFRQFLVRDGYTRLQNSVYTPRRWTPRTPTPRSRDSKPTFQKPGWCRCSGCPRFPSARCSRFAEARQTRGILLPERILSSYDHQA